MGVPGFFVWLQNKYRNRKDKEIIIDNIQREIDILYLDTNCLIHPQCFKVLEESEEKIETKELEEKMIERIIKYIEYLKNITRTKELYISIDGVAPIPKIIQQRKRRYRSYHYNKRIKEVKEKYNKKKGKEWSNTAITPGTEFMEKLHEKIIEYINKEEIKIEYSSYHTAGEGEHKILDDIKKKKNKNIVIYGLDADLIFLALSSNKRNIYLLREKQYIKKQEKKEKKKEEKGEYYDLEEEMCYICIDELRRRINEQIYKMIRERIEIEKKDYCDDFIVLSFFLGNDFLPHIPSINIKTRGLDYILECYVNVYSMIRENMIIRKNKEIEINEIYLELLIDKLASNENYYFKKIYPEYKKRIKSRICKEEDEYKKEIWEIEHLKKDEIKDEIKLGKGELNEYKYRYYEYYFNIEKEIKKEKEKICEEYIKGIIWVYEYYFKGNKENEWYYPYIVGPFISDVREYIKKIDIKKIEFKKTELITPYTQLMIVLPPQQKELLPKELHNLMTEIESPLIEYYPLNIKIDYINKDMEWKGEPYLPIININKIRDCINNIKIENIKRNIIKKTYINKK